MCSSGKSAKVAVLVLIAIAGPSAAQSPLGIFDGSVDVGDTGHAGSTTYDPDTDSYTITGSGTNMWFAEDAFQFAFKRMSGDFILTANAELIGEGTDPHRKMGWIIRTGMEPDAPYIDIAVHGDGLVSTQFRRTAGADTEQIQSRIGHADVIQLARIGGTFRASVARSGDPFTTDDLADLDLGDEVLVGLFVCAHNNPVTETAVFRNVRITVPAAPDFVPYQDYIGARLETLDVKTGARTQLFETPEPIQAPNWTIDGDALIYNLNGLLYRFELAGRAIRQINTGFADQNNNDHVLSFDGKSIAISHHTPDHDGQSIIYTVPIDGGAPRQVTDTGPSYLHGWSPDGESIVYTALRDGRYNVFAIPAEGGAERQLTDTPGLDDGPEYSPDGEYIYFNSARSGTMQIWRMKPDGSDPEQVTFDELNDWFPHVSPDGKWIAFLSYEKDVDAEDHPYYKQVYIRVVPTDRPEGVRPGVVAYVYGGQGTLNVPSWSPDSRRIAFVSNTVTGSQR